MKKIVFTFGRMNPPTIGHEKLANKVKSVGASEKADVRIYLSHSSGSRTKSGENKDPLDYATKLKYAQKAFGKAVYKSNSKVVIQILKELEKDGYTDVVMVVGSDRVAEFKGLLNKYNGKDYNFDSIKVVSAGARDADAVGVAGMSASKMREAVMKADGVDATWVDSKNRKQPSFRSGLPKEIQKDAQAIWDILKRELKEEMTEEALSIQQRLARGRVMKRNAKKIARMRKIKSKRRASTDQLQKRARKKAIQMVRKKVAGDRGSNYNSLSSSEKQTIDKMVAKKKQQVDRIAKKLLNKVRKSETERLSKARSVKKEEVEMKSFSDLFEATAKDRAKDKIAREKELDKAKHDRMMDRARTADTQKKNQQTEEKDTHKTKDGRTAKKGLWYNINQKKKRGEKPNPPGHPDRPTAKDFEKSRETTKESTAAYSKAMAKQNYDRLTKNDQDKLAKLRDMMAKEKKKSKKEEVEEAKTTRTSSQLAIRDTNRRFDRAKKTAKKDDDNSKYRTSKSGNVFVGLKKEEVGESATPMRNLKLINKIKKSGTVKTGSMKKESGGAGEYGTDKLRKNYAKETPMERMDPKAAMMDKAIDALHRRVQSKGDKESIGSYAFDVARSFKGISSRELEKAYREKHK